ncbi:nitrogen regulation protein NR(II) [Roseateles sp. BYS180W]|uniref:histidine kinase n=1 Tax=Roseateles rivi TaxID=3299028 RepID=A0ABW7FW62_9BURK
MTPAPALDALSTLLIVLDAQGRCLWVNAAVEALLRHPRRSLAHAEVAQWLQEPQRLREAMRGVLDNSYASRRFDAVLAPAGQEPQPVHAVLSQLDGSADLLLEMALSSQQQRQEREERSLDQMRSNKELVRNLAHEIKNPLGGIRGAAQLMEMELAPHLDGHSSAALNPELRDYIGVILHEVDRLQLLVDRLLAPHRHAPVLGPVNIHEVCERVRAVVLAQYPRGLSIQRDYDTSLPELRGDREQLIQALLNLVQNAAQALVGQMADQSACITLRTRVARQVTLGKRRWRLALELQVQDNGPGVPQELQERVFLPLVSGRDGGTGLGLTLAQTFVQQHNGLLDFESQPGRTVFRITLPLEEDSAGERER